MLAGGDDGTLGGLDLDMLVLDVLKDIERRPVCRGRSLSEGLSVDSSAGLLGLVRGEGVGIGLGKDRTFVASQSSSPRPKPVSNDTC